MSASAPVAPDLLAGPLALGTGGGTGLACATAESLVRSLAYEAVLPRSVHERRETV